MTDAWLGRNNKKLQLRDIGLFLREQDSVGEPAKPPPETDPTLLEAQEVLKHSRAMTVAKLDEILNEEHVEQETQKPRQLLARENLVSRERASHWLEVVRVPGAVVGKSTSYFRGSRSEVEELLLPLLPPDEPLYEVPVKVSPQRNFVHLVKATKLTIVARLVAPNT